MVFLIDLENLIQKYSIRFKGVLHVGAHECEEIHQYEKYLPRNKILWVEALLDKVQISKSRYDNLLIEFAVVSDKYEIVNWNRANNGESSSMFNFGSHKNSHPGIHYVVSGRRKAVPLSHFIGKYNINFNFLNLDVQGAELKALKGMESYLNNIDYIYTEINRAYVYEGCVLIGELDAYLARFNLHRVETLWIGDYNYGEAFYIRK
jgi:FkbM family methyltransferase